MNRPGGADRGTRGSVNRVARDAPALSVIVTGHPEHRTVRTEDVHQSVTPRIAVDAIERESIDPSDVGVAARRYARRNARSATCGHHRGRGPRRREHRGRPSPTGIA